MSVYDKYAAKAAGLGTVPGNNGYSAKEYFTQNKVSATSSLPKAAPVGRPYENVGKMTINLAGLGEEMTAKYGNQPGMADALTGHQKFKGDFGQTVGDTLDAAWQGTGNMLPAGMWMAHQFRGAKEFADQHRVEFATFAREQGYDPATVESVNRNVYTDFWRKNFVEKEGGSALFADFVIPDANSSVADALLGTVGALFAAPERIWSRAWAGAGSRYDDLINATDREMEGQLDLIAIRDKAKSGEWSKERTLDELVKGNYGITNPMGQSDWAQHIRTMGGGEGNFASQVVANVAAWFVSTGVTILSDPINILSLGGAGVVKMGVKGAAGVVTSLLDDAGRAAIKGAGAGAARTAARDAIEMDARRVMSDRIYSYAQREGIAAPTELQAVEAAIRAGDEVVKAAVSRSGISRPFITNQQVAKWVQKVDDVLNPLTLFSEFKSGGKALNRMASLQMTSAFIEGVTGGAITTTGRALAEAGVSSSQFGDDMGTAIQNIGNQIGVEAVARHTVMVGKSNSDITSSALLTDAGSKMLEKHGADVGRMMTHKVDKIRQLIVPREGENMAMALQRERDELAPLLVNMYGIHLDKATTALAKLGENELIAVRMLSYGRMAEDLLAARAEAVQQAIAAGMSTEFAERLIYLGPTQLSLDEARAIRAAIKRGDTNYVRTAVSRWDILEFNVPYNLHDSELLLSVSALLDSVWDQLPKAIPADKLTPAMAAFEAKYAGFAQVGLKPEIPLQTVLDRNGRVIAVDPFADYTTSKYGMNTPGKVAVAKQGLLRKISGSQVINDQRRRFVQDMSARVGMPREWSEALFTALNNRAHAGTMSGMRGLSPEEVQSVLKEMKLPDEMLRKASKRQMQLAIFWAMKGDTGKVGLSQAATGWMKNMEVRLTGGIRTAMAGTEQEGTQLAALMADRIYPLMRFKWNAQFRLQERFEAPFLLMARGYTSPTQLVVKPYKGVRGVVAALSPKAAGARRATLRKHVTDPKAHELATQTAGLMDAFATGTRTMQDTVEATSIVRAGATAASRIAGSDEGRMLQKLLNDRMDEGIKTRGQILAFRRQLGRDMGSIMKRESPAQWQAIKSFYGTKDDGEAAVRWFNDAIARSNPESAFSAVKASGDTAAFFRPSFLGERSRFSPVIATEALSIGIGSVSKDATWRSLRERWRDAGDSDVTEETVTDALRAMGADEDYIQRTKWHLDYDTPEQWEAKLAELTDPELARAHMRMYEIEAAHQGVPVLELLADQHAGAPLSLDQLGTPTPNTLFQLITDTMSNRGMRVVDADDPLGVAGGVVAQHGAVKMPDIRPPETGGVTVLWAGRPEAPHVEMVPLSALSGVASNGRGTLPDDEWNALKATTSKEVKTKTGVKATIRGLDTPIRMDWSPVDNTVKWQEGDARIAALLESVPAEKHGETYVPVYVSTRNTAALAGTPSPSKLAPDEAGVLPPMVRPSDIGYGTAESAAIVKREYYTTNLVKDLTDGQKKARGFQKARASRAVNSSLGTPLTIAGATGGRITAYRRGASRGKDFTLPQQAGKIEPPVGQKAYYYIALDEDDLMLTRARGVVETSRLTTHVPTDEKHWVEVFLTDSEYQKNIGVGPNRLSVANEPWHAEYRKMTGPDSPQTRAEFMREYGSVLHEETSIGKAARQRLRDLQDRTEGDTVHRLGVSNNPEEIVNEYLAVMSHDELVEYSQWYPQMRRAMLALSDNQAEVATKYLIAFGVTQLNTSPIDGMKFMLEVMHRLSSGATLPDVEDVLKRVAGLNGPLLVKLLREYETEGTVLSTEGLGQKLIDFIDSLLGAKTRTIPVSGPKGTWSPVAGDIWAMRDAGFVDAKMYNHLVHAYGEYYDIEKQGARMVKNAQGEEEEEVADFLFTERATGKTFNIKTVGSSPTDVQYDYIVEYYNGIADYMNEIGFLGRNDWMAAEAQSLGWFKAKRVFGDDTGDPAGAFGASTWSSNMALEQLPTRAYPTDGYPRLYRDTSRQVAQRMATPLIDEAAHISGVRVVGMRESVTFDEVTGAPIASVNAELFTNNEGAETHAAVQGITARAPRVRVTKRTQTTPTPGNITRDGIEFSFPSDWTQEEVLAIAEELAERDEFFRDADIVFDDNENHLIRVVAREGENITAFQARKSDADLMDLWQEYVGEGGYPRGRYVDPSREAGIRSMGEDIVAGSFQSRAPATAIYENVEDVTQRAWDSTHKGTGALKPESGMTLDAHTGKKPGARGRRAGGGPYVTAVGHTISVPVGATREEFDEAFQQFLDVSADDLSRTGAALGVFHNAETNTIDFDVNLVVNTYEEAEALQLYLGRHGGAFNLTTSMRSAGAATAQRNVYRPIFDPQKAFGFERIYADTVELTNDWVKYPNGEQYREVLDRPIRGDQPKGGTGAPVRARQHIIDQLDDEVDLWSTMVREDAYQKVAPRELASFRESRRVSAEPGYALDANGRSSYLDSSPRGRRGTILAAADARRAGALFQRTDGGTPRGAITNAGGAYSTTGAPAQTYLSPRRQRKDTPAHEAGHDYVNRFLQPSGIRRVKQIYSNRTGRALDAADHRATTLTVDEQEWLADQFVEYLRQGPDAMADPTLVPLAEHYARTLTDRTREAAPLTPETIAYNAAEVRYQRALAQHEFDKTVHDAAEAARFASEQKAYDEAVAAQAAAAPTPTAAAAPVEAAPRAKSPELTEAEDQASAIAAVYSKWDERGTKNAAQMEKDLDRLEAADIDVGEQRDLLDDYNSIERGDFSEASEYSEYRQAAWDDLMDSLNTKAETHVEDTGLLDEVDEVAPEPLVVDRQMTTSAPRDILDHYDNGKPGISYAHDNKNNRDVVVIFRDSKGRPMGYARMDAGGPGSVAMRRGPREAAAEAITPGHVNNIHIFVKPGARRQGVATQLYEWLEDEGWNLDDVLTKGEFTQSGADFADTYLARKGRPTVPAAPVGTSAAPPPPPVAPTPAAPYAGVAPTPLGPRPPQPKTQVRELSPEAKELFDQLGQRKPTGRQPFGFDADEEMLMQWMQVAHRRADRMASDLIHFKGERSWLERSLNHPFFGLYPLSYMWGKVLPEMIEFLAFRPFGFKTPYIGYDLTQQMYQHMMLQQEYDPELREFMKKNENAWRALSMFVPGLPWDLPVNVPLWARRYFEAVATNLTADQAGMKPENYGAWNAFVSDVDLARVTLETAAYASPLYSATQLAKVPGMIADLGEPTEEDLAREAAEAAAGGSNNSDWDFIAPTVNAGQQAQQPTYQTVAQSAPVLAQQQANPVQIAKPSGGYEEPFEPGSIGELTESLEIEMEDVVAEISE